MRALYRSSSSGLSKKPLAAIRAACQRPQRRATIVLKAPFSLCRGNSLVDALLALLLFSIGMLGLLRLMSSTLVEAGNAQYRSQASSLASALVARMWTGDRSLAALQARYGDITSVDYQAWQRMVNASLPGSQAAALQPVVSIDTQRRVMITLRWKIPSDRSPHQLQVQAQITD